MMRKLNSTPINAGNPGDSNCTIRGSSCLAHVLNGVIITRFEVILRVLFAKTVGRDNKWVLSMTMEELDRACNFIS